MDLSGYRKRTQYPDDGQVVVDLKHNEDGTITVVYEDNTYMVVRKVGK
jgi:hypothetical protein